MATAGRSAPDRDVSPSRDPFLTAPSGPTRLRYSNFDSNLFSLGHAASPGQAKRALKAHLADTQQRMEEAGKLGTTLLQQQKELTERIKEVEKLQAEEAELTPELNRKLADLENEYMQVARDSARAFIPKQRIPSSEDPTMAAASPYAPQGTGGRRSVSPSKFESRASGSPTKLSVPNRKQRNQPVSRIHDIEFATEISASLIQQVRHLQGLLAEREEELKDTKSENSRLEMEYEAFQHRVKALDESEHKYKDENWNLETQVHELLAAQKEAADREKKLTQALNALQADKNTTQRELDEVKLNFSKLDEKHAAAVKQHDIDLGTAKRKEVLADSERAAMHRKIEDLTSQNQELAKAFSLQRGRALEREAAFGLTDEELENGRNAATPEHSPPPSPIKGTPRHPALESETLKSSLQHSQRTIQTLRNNIHREKTEKLELRRLLHEARDELEKARSDPNTAHRRSRKVESREFKKPLRPGQLGSSRTSRSEISLDDPEWEDHTGFDASISSSTRSPAVTSSSRNSTVIAPIPELGADDNFLTAAESTDAAFETAAETDAGFETARERGGTETEDFHTGAEEFSDDDDATETEGSPSRRAGAGKMQRPPVLPYGHSRYSFESTASTSGDEDDDYSYGSQLKTPTAINPQKLKLRDISKGGFNLAGRRSRIASEEPSFNNSSPVSASFNRSVSGTPQAPGQSLFAELNEFEGSEDESFNGEGMTPSRRSTRSFTPASARGFTASPTPAVPTLPKPAMVTQGTMTDPVFIDDVRHEPVTVASVPKFAMVDSGIMTEEVEHVDSHEQANLSPHSVVFNERPVSMASVTNPEKLVASTQWLGDEFQDGTRSRPLSAFSYSDSGIQYEADLGDKLAQFPAPPTSAQRSILPPPQELSVSHIHSEHVEPEAEFVPVPPTPVALELSSMLAEHVEPEAEPVPEPPVPAPLGMSTTVFQHVEPVEHHIEIPAPPRLDASPLLVLLDDEPILPAEPAPISTIFADIQAVEVQPVEEEIVEREIVPVVAPVPVPVPAPPMPLAMSILHAEEVYPQEEEVKEAPAPLTFSLGPVEQVEPQDAPVPATVPLSVAMVTAEEVLPQELPLPEPVPLSVTPVQAEEVVPQEASAPEPILLSVVSGQAEEVQPREEPQPAPAAPVALSITPPLVEEVQPIHELQPPAPVLSHAEMLALDVEPVHSPKPEKKKFPILGLSTIQSLDTEPIEFQHGAAPLEFSSMSHLESVPVADSPRSPKRDGLISTQRDMVMSGGRDAEDLPETPTNALFGSFRTRNKVKTHDSSETTFIAEDETRQSLNASPVAETPESQRPFKERSSNTDARPVRKEVVPMSDSGAQTSLTADAIDEMLKASKPKPLLAPFVIPPFGSRQEAQEAKDPFVATPEPSAAKRRSQDSGFDTMIRTKGRGVDAEGTPDSPATAKRIVTPMPLARRPSTASSYEPSPPPPLPPNHKQVIEAARLGSSGSGQGTINDPHSLSQFMSAGGAQDVAAQSPTRRGSMGPPPLPVKQSMESSRLGSSHGGQETIVTGSMGPPPLPTHSRSRSYRPNTPKLSTVAAASGRTTPTTVRHGRADIYPQTSRGNGQLSHKSSMSSFVSELDNRFDIHSDMAIGAGGVFGVKSPTDPRMIRAITQVMIGEWLYKYTRKVGRGEMSDNRHRRYFWLHPYNRTLYWSETDPGDASRAEVKSKSLVISAVRMVADNNINPPGLHHKSLLVISGKRTIKFTAPTSQRHEIWFNALSFVLKKPGEDEEVLDELADGITQEDVNEFNPGYSARAANGTRAGMASPSMASYSTRATVPQSPVLDTSMDIPTLTPQTRHRTSQTRLSTIGRINNYWGSLRGRSVDGRQPSVYRETSDTQLEANDSAEDLRVMLVNQNQESDRLENVRACCDGKHDVGGLHTFSPKKARHSHAHPPTPTRGRDSTTPSAMGSIRSRA